jgi:hypothetical protein
MPIKRLVEGCAFDSDEVELLVRVFEAALRDLNLAHGADPATEMVANRIIELALRGERDPVRLRQDAVRGIWASVVPFTLPKPGALLALTETLTIRSGIARATHPRWCCRQKPRPFV